MVWRSTKVAREDCGSVITALLLHPIQVIAERVEALLPPPLHPLGPAGDLIKGLRAQPIDALLSNWFDGNDAGLAQQTEVAGDGRLADGEQLDELRDAAIVGGERLNNLLAGYVGEGR